MAQGSQGRVCHFQVAHPSLGTPCHFYSNKKSPRRLRHAGATIPLAFSRKRLEVHDVVLLEGAAFSSEVLGQRLAQEEHRDLVKLLGGINVSKLVGVNRAAHLVAVGDCQVDVGCIEAIRDQRVHVAVLHCLQVGEVIRIGGDIFLDQSDVSALEEDVVRLRGGYGFEIDVEATASVVSVSDVGSVGDREGRETCFGASEAMTTAEADATSIGGLGFDISRALGQIGLGILHELDDFRSPVLGIEDFAQHCAVIVEHLVEHDVAQRDADNGDAGLCLQGIGRVFIDTRNDDLRSGLYDGFFVGGDTLRAAFADNWQGGEQVMVDMTIGAGYGIFLLAKLDADNLVSCLQVADHAKRRRANADYLLRIGWNFHSAADHVGNGLRGSSRRIS